MTSAVICRQHSSSNQYSRLLNKAVPICSLRCNDDLDFKVCDAARATSAAPTFFPVMRIEDSFFADGGLAHNNPSFAIYFHYTANERKRSTRPLAPSADWAPQFSSHGDLDCSRVRFTNIGTGAKAGEVEPRKREWFASLIPSPIRNGVFLKQTLTDIAVESENKAEIMRQFQRLNPNKFIYERFDASHGVSNIKLDDYNALGEIRRKTEQYLEEQETKRLLKVVGQAIATDYLDSHPKHGQAVQPADIAIKSSRQSLKPSSITFTFSSHSSGPSSHSNYPESDVHTLNPSRENIQDDAPAPGADHPADTRHLPAGRQQSKDYAHEDHVIDIIEPETRMAAAPA